ncbi:MAG: signal recognition particle protein [Deltaproteobacteria bacterium]|nr:signal recognition particle protein [Deltaproteobacteria bacterium]
MFDSLTDKLSAVLKKVHSRGIITSDNIEDTLRDIRLSLLEADVHYRVVSDLILHIKAKALGEKVLKSLTPGQVFTKIVQEELTQVMGGEPADISLNAASPIPILILGLQGSGKTTTTIKLARYLEKKKKKRVLVVPADTTRPAAIEQLILQAAKNNISYFNTNPSYEPSKIVKLALEQAQKECKDCVLIDTAGRLHIDEKLMDELQLLQRKYQPHESLLVLDSMTGHDAVNSAQSFCQKIKVTGFVLTKLDGDSKAGAALSIRHVTNIPIKFVGLGEKVEDLDLFYPDRIASRILDRGDIIGLVEKVQVSFEEKEQRILHASIERRAFSLDDFLGHIRMMKKMGPLEGVLKHLPGMKTLKGFSLGAASRQMKETEAILCSMTFEERRNPKILNGSRRLRIARGSGTHVSAINRLMNQYETAKKMMKKMKQFSRLGF